MDLKKIVSFTKHCLRQSDDLRLPKYQGRKHLGGHCYVASEALYHLLGGKQSGWKPMFIRHEGEPHWFLMKDHMVLDLTELQFETVIPYGCARGKGFLTKHPSKRAKILMNRIKEREEKI